MNVLALDGAFGAFSAAVASGAGVVASRSEPGNVALERGLHIVAEVLTDAALPGRRIDRLAVGVGPGGFTGLRIAIAYAKSLASVWQCPLVPIDSFDLLEHGRSFDTVLAVVVGRPGIISARYRRGAHARRASGRIAQVLAEVLPAPLRGGSLDVLGAPEDVLHALAERDIIVRLAEPAFTPAAAAALAAPSRAPAASPHEVRADYGELPAAKAPRF
jgi:tRNA threonylcarbamoyladenosine biosynthesis protein TsaB